MTDILLIAGTSVQNEGILGRIIIDAVAFGISYVTCFIGCDLVFNHFSLQQSLKSSYWFFLGPFLWKWGTAIPWVYAIIKNMIENEWKKVEGELIDWIKNQLLFTYVPEPLITGVAKKVDDMGPQILDNFSYLKNELHKY